MSTTDGYPLLAQSGPDTPAQLARVVNGAVGGKTNNTGLVTLTGSATSTTLTDTRIGGNSVILFVPRTAHAAAMSPGPYAATNAQFKGSATITHTSVAQSDLTFAYVIVG